MLGQNQKEQQQQQANKNNYKKMRFSLFFLYKSPVSTKKVKYKKKTTKIVESASKLFSFFYGGSSKSCAPRSYQVMNFYLEHKAAQFFFCQMFCEGPHLWQKRQEK